MRTLVLVSILLGAAVAHAEPAPDPDVDQPRSAFTAEALSIGIPTASVGLAIAVESLNPRGTSAQFGDSALVLAGTGFAIGPSIGHWYAGDYFSTGTKIRIAGVLLFAAGAPGFAINFDCRDFDCPPRSTYNEISNALVVGGVVAFLGGTIWDMASAGHAARRYNREHHVSAMAIAPTILRAPSGSAGGMAVTGRF